MPIRMTGMASGIDVDAVVKEMMSAQKLKKTNLEGKKEKLSWKQDKWKEMNTKLYSFYTDKVSKARLSSSYNAKKVTPSDETKVSATATSAVNGSYSLSIEKLASAEYVTGSDIKSKGLTSDSKLSDAGMEVGQKITIKAGTNLNKTFEFEVTEDSTIADFTNKLKEAGLNASFDAKNGRFFIAAKDTGAENRFTIVSDATETGKGLDALGLTNIDENLATNGADAQNSSQVAIVAAQDAKIKLNGAVIEASSNNINVNGMSLELKGTTNADGIKLNVTKDTSKVYDMVKDFVKGYNELMTEMYEKYNAPSSRGYAMLTSEQKEAMSDDEVKLWEDKIKNSLLRGDDTLSDLMSTFRTAMQGTIEVNGEKYSLANFGIVTGNYTEHGLLHIQGDADDGEYASKTNKLMEALENDPEGVEKALSGIMSNFYDKLFNKMGATKLSSALTFYNDKQMKTQTESYEKEIKSWESKLQDIEDRYYKQFSAMESAMAELQNKQSQLAGFFA